MAAILDFGRFCESYDVFSGCIVFLVYENMGIDTNNSFLCPIYYIKEVRGLLVFHNSVVAAILDFGLPRKKLTSGLWGLYGF